MSWLVEGVWARRDYPVQETPFLRALNGSPVRVITVRGDIAECEETRDGVTRRSILPIRNLVPYSHLPQIVLREFCDWLDADPKTAWIETNIVPGTGEWRVCIFSKDGASMDGYGLTQDDAFMGILDHTRKMRSQSSKFLGGVISSNGPNAGEYLGAQAYLGADGFASIQILVKASNHITLTQKDARELFGLLRLTLRESINHE